jgi:hypothetical protein
MARRASSSISSSTSSSPIKNPHHLSLMPIPHVTAFYIAHHIVRAGDEGGKQRKGKESAETSPPAPTSPSPTADMRDARSKGHRYYRII